MRVGRPVVKLTETNCSALFHLFICLDLFMFICLLPKSLFFPPLFLFPTNLVVVILESRSQTMMRKWRRTKLERSVCFNEDTQKQKHL